jgi:hypothetical protein
MVIGAAALCYLMEWAIVLGVRWAIGAWPEPWERPQLHNMAIAFGLMGLALWRGKDINPVLNEGYRSWLRATPWTAARPLPLGSVQLGWPDALILGAAVLCWTAPASAVYLLLAFFVPYCFCLGPSNLLADEFVAFYGALGLAIGLPLVMESPWQALAVTAAMAAVCQWGFVRGLRRFPWDDSKVRAALAEPPQRTVDYWPRVLPAWLHSAEPRVGVGHLLAASALAG